MKEEKKKEADVEAAKIYEQFVQSFDGGGADDGKTFLRGGVAGAPAGRGTLMGAPPGRGVGGPGGAVGAYGPASGGGGGAGVPMPSALAG